MRKQRAVRSPATQESYQKYLAEKRPGCPFCFEDGLERTVLKRYKYWYVTASLFPYDVDYSVNNLLVPNRHLEHLWDCNEEEALELMEIRKELSVDREYDELLENFPVTRSQIHFHLHLLAY